MARLVYHIIGSSSDPLLKNNYTTNPMVLIDAQNTFAQYNDLVTGNQIILFGSNFRYENGVLVGGKVTGVNLATIQGETFASMSGLNQSGAKIGALIIDLFGGPGVFQALFRGDDVMTGRGFGIVDDMVGEAGNDILKARSGDDILTGGTGDDILSGGKGNDIFVFNAGSGVDRVTDFNVGNDINFDAIFCEDPVSFSQTSDGDLVIRFDSVNAVILEGVDFSQRNDVQIIDQF